MPSTTPRARFALLLSASLITGLMVVPAVAVGADDDDEGGSGIGFDALGGLAAPEGDADRERPSTGDLNDPLGGGTGGSSVEGETEGTDTEPASTEGSDSADPAAISANPMFKLMADLIAADVGRHHRRVAGVG